MTVPGTFIMAQNVCRYDSTAPIGWPSRRPRMTATVHAAKFFELESAVTIVGAKLAIVAACRKNRTNTTSVSVWP